VILALAIVLLRPGKSAVITALVSVWRTTSTPGVRAATKLEALRNFSALIGAEVY
jgi:hypothetical protein